MGRRREEKIDELRRTLGYVEGYIEPCVGEDGPPYAFLLIALVLVVAAVVLIVEAPSVYGWLVGLAESVNNIIR